MITHHGGFAARHADYARHSRITICREGTDDRVFHEITLSLDTFGVMGDLQMVARIVAMNLPVGNGLALNHLDKEVIDTSTLLEGVAPNHGEHIDFIDLDMRHDQALEILQKEADKGNIRPAPPPPQQGAQSFAW